MEGSGAYTEKEPTREGKSRETTNANLPKILPRGDARNNKHTKMPLRTYVLVWVTKFTLILEGKR